MKKFLAILLALALALSLMVGCGNEPAAPVEDDTFTVGFSVITLTIEYYAQMKDAFESICAEKGWDFIVTESGQDVEATLNDCMDLLEKGVDALVIASWYGDSMGEVLEVAEQKGTPVWFMNTGGLEEDQSWIEHVIADDVAVGNFAGVWAGKQQMDLDKTEVNVVSLSTASSVGRNRVDGFLAGLEQAGLKVNLLNEYLGSTREDYLGAMEDALVAYDKIDLVYGVSTVCQLGAYDAVSAAQRTDEVTILGWDVSAEDKEVIDSRQGYIGAVEVDPVYEMTIALDNLEKYIAGEDVPKVCNYYPNIYSADGYVYAADVLG